ncbi:hypothetical protein GCM10022236_01840 [Microlunatus ginsengisoli]|uniref:Low molecular weight protein antigen 6 PH domain-containing protein n=2 Tax=Microlunatus ginsengisoli TaxID=363863 RepID=A0ABP6ZAY9_9ACTN
MPEDVRPEDRPPDARPPEDGPVVYRPRLLRLVATVASGSLVLLSFVGWFGLPAGLRAQFLPSQIVTLLLILAFIVGFMWALAASYVRADATGLKFRNGLRTHSIAWADIHKILLRPGDAWALVLIRPDDGPMESELDAEKRHVLGIQAGDGQPAIAAVEDLRRRLAASRAH